MLSATSRAGHDQDLPRGRGIPGLLRHVQGGLVGLVQEGATEERISSKEVSKLIPSHPPSPLPPTEHPEAGAHAHVPPGVPGLLCRAHRPQGVLLEQLVGCGGAPRLQRLIASSTLLVSVLVAPPRPSHTACQHGHEHGHALPCVLLQVHASLIVVLTRGGSTARLVAKYRPLVGGWLAGWVLLAGFNGWLTPTSFFQGFLPPAGLGCSCSLAQQVPSFTT